MAIPNNGPLRACEPDEYYMAGAYSPSLQYAITHLVISAQYPLGRLTQDERLAWTWAHEDAVQFNQDPQSPARDWIANVRIETNPYEQVQIEPGAE